VFAFSGALFAYTFSRLPPVPTAVVAQNGTVLFTRQQAIMGKYYLQRYGLMDYGSIEGMGHTSGSTSPPTPLSSTSSTWPKEVRRNIILRNCSLSLTTF
jgi:hypothetical protein